MALDLGTLVAGFRADTRQFNASVQSTVESVDKFKKGIDQASDSVEKMERRLGSSTGTLRNIASTVSGVMSAVTGGIFSVLLLVPALGTLFSMVGSVVSSVIGLVRGVVSAITTIIQTVFSLIATVVRTVVGAVRAVIDNMTVLVSRFLGATGRVISGAVSGIAGLIGVVVSQVQRYANMIDETAKTADRLGMTIQGLEGLRLAASRSGVSATQLELVLRRMNQALSQAARGQSRAQRSLSDLGLTLEELTNLDVVNRLALIADRLRGVEDHLVRVGIARDLLGRTGEVLLPFLSIGGDRIRDLTNELDDLAGVISDKGAAAVEAMNDDIEWLRVAMTRTWRTLTVAVAPFVSRFVLFVLDTIREGSRQWQALVERWVENAWSLFSFLVAALTPVLHELVTTVRVVAQQVGSFVSRMIARLGEGFASAGDIASQLEMVFLRVRDGVVALLVTIQHLVSNLPRVFSVATTIVGHFFDFFRQFLNNLPDWWRRTWEAMLPVLQGWGRRALQLVENVARLMLRVFINVFARSAADGLVTAMGNAWQRIGARAILELSKLGIRARAEIDKSFARLDELVQAPLEFRLPDFERVEREQDRKLNRQLSVIDSMIRLAERAPVERTGIDAAMSRFRTEIAQVYGEGGEALRESLARGITDIEVPTLAIESPLDDLRETFADLVEDARLAGAEIGEGLTERIRSRLEEVREQSEELRRRFARDPERRPGPDPADPIRASGLAAMGQALTVQRAALLAPGPEHQLRPEISLLQGILEQSRKTVGKLSDISRDTHTVAGVPGV